MCSINCAVNIDFKPRAVDAPTRNLLIATALAGATWLVTLGGLASVQDFLLSTSSYGNAPQIGVGSTQNTEALRYFWFIVSWELVTLLVLAYYTMGGMLHARRGTVVGLLSIATYLFIQFSQDFLTLRNEWDHDVERDRSSTVCAGAIMTGTMNAILIILAGMETSTEVPTVSLEVAKN